MAYRGQGRGGKDPSSKVFSHSGDPQGGHSNRPLIRHSCCHGFHIGGQTKKAGQPVSSQSDQLSALLRAMVQFRYNV